MLVGQGWLASAAAEGGHAMVEAIVEAVSQGLRVLAVALALVGLLLAGLFTAARALRRDIPRRASET
jgi:hypothetical protein